MRQGFLLAALLRLSSGSENPENPNIVPVDDLTGEVEVTVTNLPIKNVANGIPEFGFELIYMNWRQIGLDPHKEGYPVIGGRENRIAPNSSLNPPGDEKDAFGQDPLGQRNITLPYPMGHFLEDLKIVVAPVCVPKDTEKASSVKKWWDDTWATKFSGRAQVGHEATERFCQTGINKDYVPPEYFANGTIRPGTYLESDPLKKITSWNLLTDIIQHNETRMEENSHGVKSYRRKINSLNNGAGGQVAEVVVVLPTWVSVLAHDPTPIITDNITDNTTDRLTRSSLEIQKCMRKVNDAIWKEENDANGRPVQDFMHRGNRGLGDNKINVAFMFPGLNTNLKPGNLSGNGARQGRMWFRDMCMQMVNAKSEFVLVFTPVTYRYERAIRELYHSQGMMWMTTYMKQAYVDPILSTLARERKTPTALFTGFSMGGIIATLNAIELARLDTMTTATKMLMHNPYSDMKPHDMSGNKDEWATRGVVNRIYYPSMPIHCPESGVREVMEKIMRDTDWVKPEDSETRETANFVTNTALQGMSPQYKFGFTFGQSQHETSNTGDFFGYDTYDSPNNAGFCINARKMRPIIWNGSTKEMVDIREAALSFTGVKSAKDCLTKCNNLENCQFWEYKKNSDGSEDCRYWDAQYWFEHVDTNMTDTLMIRNMILKAGKSEAIGERNCIFRERTQSSGSHAGKGTGGYLSYYQERLEVCYNKQLKKQQSLGGRNTPQKRIYGLKPGKGNPYTLGGVLTMGTPVHTLYSTQTGKKYLDDISMAKKNLITALGQRSTVMDETMDMTDEIYGGKFCRGKNSNHVLGKIIAYDGHYIQNYRRQGSPGVQSVQVWHVNRFTDKTVGYQANVYRGYDELGFMSRAWQKKEKTETTMGEEKTETTMVLSCKWADRGEDKIHTGDTTELSDQLPYKYKKMMYVDDYENEHPIKTGISESNDKADNSEENYHSAFMGSKHWSDCRGNTDGYQYQNARLHLVLRSVVGSTFGDQAAGDVCKNAGDVWKVSTLEEQKYGPHEQCPALGLKQIDYSTGEYDYRLMNLQESHNAMAATPWRGYQWRGMDQSTCGRNSKQCDACPKSDGKPLSKTCLCGNIPCKFGKVCNKDGSCSEPGHHETEAYDGQACIAYRGTPAVCGYHYKDYAWCWTESNWAYCKGSAWDCKYGVAFDPWAMGRMEYNQSVKLTSPNECNTKCSDTEMCYFWNFNDKTKECEMMKGFDYRYESPPTPKIEAFDSWSGHKGCKLAQW